MTTNTQSTLIPFVIELNGVNFKELTKDLQKPLDGVFAAAMQSTLRELCRSIPGCTFGMTEYGRIVLCVSGVEAVEKEEYASLATKLFHQEFRIAAENWMIDEGIRMPMYTLQRDPHFCPSDEVLRLEKVYLSLFDKGEFEACICTGDTPKWDIVGLGKVDTRFYLFYRRQNHALGLLRVVLWQRHHSWLSCRLHSRRLLLSGRERQCGEGAPARTAPAGLVYSGGAGGGTQGERQTSGEVSSRGEAEREAGYGVGRRP